MPKNLVSATLSPQDRDEILAAIATIKTKLPFLLTLTPEESKSLPRLGDKSRAFTAKALEIALQQSDFLPRALDIEEFKQDLALFEALYPITVALTQLAELVNDTTAVAGSEAYGAARIVYIAIAISIRTQASRYAPWHLGDNQTHLNNDEFCF